MNILELLIITAAAAGVAALVVATRRRRPRWTTTPETHRVEVNGYPNEGFTLVICAACGYLTVGREWACGPTEDMRWPAVDQAIAAARQHLAEVGASPTNPGVLYSPDISNSPRGQYV